MCTVTCPSISPLNTVHHLKKSVFKQNLLIIFWYWYLIANAVFLDTVWIPFSAGWHREVNLKSTHFSEIILLFKIVVHAHLRKMTATPVLGWHSLLEFTSLLQTCGSTDLELYSMFMFVLVKQLSLSQSCTEKWLIQGIEMCGFFFP